MIILIIVYYLYMYYIHIGLQKFEDKTTRIQKKTRKTRENKKVTAVQKFEMRHYNIITYKYRFTTIWKIYWSLIAVSMDAKQQKMFII